MLSALLEPPKQQPRSRAFWIVLGMVAFAQLVAMWMVCSHQVRLAEARQSDHQVQQMALADCLQYIPGSTIGNCQTRLNNSAPVVASSNNGLAAVSSTQAMGAGPAPTGGTFPVSFSR